MNSNEVAELVKANVDETKIVNERCLYATSDKKRLKGILESLKSHGVTHISTITGVDNGTSVELIYQFDCKPAFLNLKIFLAKDDLSVPTIIDLFPGAILYERDIMESFGVKVEGHPDPRRLFLPDDWPEGDYPLRKDRKVPTA